MLIRITEYQKLNTRKLMDVYSESNYENTEFCIRDTMSGKYRSAMVSLIGLVKT